MIPVKYIDPDDLPLYALQLLAEDEMEEMTSSLQYSVEGRRLLAEIQGDLAALAHTTDLHTPPAAAKQRLMKQVAQEAKEVPAGPLDRYVVPIDQLAPRSTAASMLDEEPLESSLLQKALPWVGWLVAAGVAVFAVSEYQESTELQRSFAMVKRQEAKDQAVAAAATRVMDTLKSSRAVHATLTSAETKPAPSARITYVADDGSLVLIASDLEPLEASKTYELWLIPLKGDPMPAGLFKPDNRGFASVVLPDLPRGVLARAFGVTIEEEGGSQVPTAPVILKGTTG